jgi:hypothetical protein
MADRSWLLRRVWGSAMKDWKQEAIEVIASVMFIPTPTRIYAQQIVDELASAGLVPEEYQLSEDEHWNGEPDMERFVTNWRSRINSPRDN